MRYVFIINPTAGKGKGVDTLVPLIENYFTGKNLEYKIVVTSAAGEAKTVAKNEALTGDEISLFACGGEGTCFEAVNGVVGYDNVRFGVIPCGSANDFLKYFGDKAHFLELENQINGTPISIDLIKAGENYCINQCSVGMDAMVADDMVLFKRLPGVSGPTAYNMAVVKTFLRKLGITAKLKIDGVSRGVVRCLFAVCANGPVYGGGYISAPHADPMDGKLEYTIVDVMSRLKVPAFLKLYSKGAHEGKKYCEMGKCEVMEIESDKPIPVNFDGEIVKMNSIRFEVVKNALKFIVPTTLAEKFKLPVATKI